MRASTLLALGAAGFAAAGFAAAGFAAAAPTGSCPSDTPSGSTPSTSDGPFEVSKFVFGCTFGCNYSFDAYFVKERTYKCSGDLGVNKDYVKCIAPDGDDSLTAYIDTSNNKSELKLQYEVTDTAAGTRTNYYGEQQVYAATSSDAAKQQPQFTVDVGSVTGVAK